MKVRLSRSQEQLWFAERLNAHPSGYQVPMALRIKGPVAETALKSALADIVERHEILRTICFEADGELRGEVRDAAEFSLEIESCSDGELRERGGIGALLDAEAEKPMDVSETIPIRAKLIRTTAEDRVLFVVVHHIAFDDWSRNQFYSELDERYRDHLTGRGRAPAPLAAQYHEYAARRDERDASRRKTSLEYWRGLLEDHHPFEITSDRPRPHRRQGRGAGTEFEIPPDLVGALSQIGAAQSASTAMVLFAAVQASLQRFTGSDEVSFGTTIAQRDEDDSLELIGPLVNTLVLRGDLSGDPAFTEMVDRMRDTLLDAMEHGDVPFSELVAEHGTTADLSRTPLVQIIVQYGSGVRRRPALEGCQVTELAMTGTGSKYDLAILFDRLDDGRLTAEIGWDRDLYTADTIKSLAESLRTVIEDVALAPEKRLSAVRTLAPRAESELLALQRGRDLESSGPSLSELVEAQARTRPESTAIITAEGRPSSYGALDAMANRIATKLRESGVNSESIVAVHAPRSLEQIAAILGVLKTGAAYLALDPDYPIERNRFMLEDSRAPVLLFQGPLPPELRQIPHITVDLGDIRAWEGRPAPNPSRPVHQDGICALIYTSGSTGRPKGVVLSHRGLAGRLTELQSEFPLKRSDKVLLKASCAFDMSITELFWPLAFGATVVLAGPGRHRDPSYLIDRIEQAEVTVASFVPSVLALMAGDGKLSACRSLRMVTAGGEELHRSLVGRLHDLLPGCEIYNGYGPTETSVYSSWRLCDSDTTGESAVEPLGSPLPNTRMYVLDAWLNPVPPGGVGGLYIGGPGVARGYLRRAGLTAERFVPDPFAPGERLYRTGDTVRYSMDTRTYRFLGRSDFQVKLGGVRVELGETEAALESHPAVAECAVVVKKTGENGWKMSAFVTLSGSVGPEALVDHARKWLPSTAVPSSITVLDELPSLPNGKVDRPRLLELETETLAPIVRTETLTEDQQALAEIWCEVLNTTGISAASDFFRCGGHSLLAIQMTNRTREWLDLEVPLSLVFEVPVFTDYYERLLEMTRAKP